MTRHPLFVWRTGAGYTVPALGDDRREQALTRPAAANGHHVGGAVDQLRADYDRTPYTSDAFPQSAPGRLAAIAHLFGLETPRVAGARVLESAVRPGQPRPLPQRIRRHGSWNRSVAGSDRPRARPRRGLGPWQPGAASGDMRGWTAGAWAVRLRHRLTACTAGLLPDVQDAILSAFRRVMAPEGVTYVSYNVYPGWKAKETMRDAMLLASGASTTPEAKVLEARRMVDFLQEVAPADGVLARVLAEFKARDEGFADSYLLHDELETFNAPCYFYEMVGRAGAHGLSYLAEAHPESMFPANHGPKVADYVHAKCGVSRCSSSSTWTSSSTACSAKRCWFTPNAPRRSGTTWTAAVTAVCISPRGRHPWRSHPDGPLTPGVPGIRRRNAVHERSWHQGSARGAQCTLAVDAVPAGVDRCGARTARRRGIHLDANLADHVDGLMEVLIAQGQVQYRLDPSCRNLRSHHCGWTGRSGSWRNRPARNVTRRSSTSRAAAPIAGGSPSAASLDGTNRDVAGAPRHRRGESDRTRARR